MVQSRTDNTMCSIHIGAVSLCRVTEGEELELCRPRTGDQVSVLIPQSRERSCVCAAFIESFTVAHNKKLHICYKVAKKNLNIGVFI